VARVRCESCKDELLVAFSCKGRGVCLSCNAKRAHVTAVQWVERVLPHRLGWVQQVSVRPDAVAETDTQFYGVGEFLLAASAVASITEG
jgi:hypothetical protein